MLDLTRYSLEILGSDMVSISANDLFDDNLGRTSFLLSCNYNTLKRIKKLLDDGSTTVSVSDSISQTGNFGALDIYDNNGDSETVHVYECRLPDNKLVLNTETEILEIRNLIGALISGLDERAPSPQYTRNYRTIPDDVYYRATATAMLMEEIEDE